MRTCEVELLPLDVDARQAKVRELLAEHRQYRTDATADLEQARPGLEVRAVTDQPMPPVLSLGDEPLLLRGAVAVDVVRRAHATDDRSQAIAPSLVSGLALARLEIMRLRG